MPEHPLACDAWQEALAAGLVAQVDPAEEAALAAHLDTCAGCATEARSLLAVSAVALGADPHGWSGPVDDVEAPAPDLGDRVVARVRRARRRGVAMRAAVVAGAAAAVIAAVAAVVTGPDPASEPPEGRPVAFATAAPGVEAEATVSEDPPGAVVQLTASGLDPDTTYALWLTPADGSYEQRVPSGTFRPDDAGEVDVRLHSAMPASEAARVWVTDPTGEITLDTQ